MTQLKSLLSFGPTRPRAHTHMKRVHTIIHLYCFIGGPWGMCMCLSIYLSIYYLLSHVQSQGRSPNLIDFWVACEHTKYPTYSFTKNCTSSALRLCFVPLPLPCACASIHGLSICHIPILEVDGQLDQLVRLPSQDR